MKKLLPLLFVFIVPRAFGQSADKEQIQRACMGYIEGFYEGDSTKLIRTLKPALYKFRCCSDSIVFPY
ncbi:MAG: hypothetical protein QM734_03625 [Cyclobacteriaceae bacterium]